MSIHNRFEGTQFISQAINIATENKITLQIGTCFARYADLISTYLPEQPVGQPFVPKQNSFRPESGFWVVGWDAAGNIVHKQALRIVDISTLTFSQYMLKSYTDFLPHGFNLDREKSYYNPGPAARKISGTVCYHGDLWISGDYRGRDLVNVLARFALANALRKWAPDFVVGFMTRSLAFRGLGEREGYMHSEPGCMYLRELGDEAFLEGFMVWMAREDLRHILTIPLLDLACQPPQRMENVAPNIVADRRIEGQVGGQAEYRC